MNPPARIAELLLHAETTLLWSTLPIAAIAALAAIAASFFQVGGLAVWSRLKPDVNRLNPVEGMERVFSTRNLVNLPPPALDTSATAPQKTYVVQPGDSVWGVAGNDVHVVKQAPSDPLDVIALNQALERRERLDPS